MATTTHNDTPAPEDAGAASTVERLEQLLEEWRARIDELLVQADLASKDIRDSVQSKAAAAQNAYLAAVNRLKELPKDAGANIGSARDGVDKLIGDMRDAYQSAESAIRRGSSD